MPPSQEKPWHTRGIGEIALHFGTDLRQGISPAAAAARLEQHGRNSITGVRKESFCRTFFDKLREPMVLLLLVTGGLYAVWGEVSDAVIILLIILALNTVEVINELRSRKAIASLHRLAEPAASVLRGDHTLTIPAEQVVPGDLLLLHQGRRVPADARLVASFNLAVDESLLTGENIPSEKSPAVISNAQLPLAERRNMVYSSTLVARGKASAIVVATGMESEVGQIAGLARQVKEPRTPLQSMMEELSKTLVWFALGFSLLVPLAGILLARQPPKQMLLTGLSLAFATIPEELPVIITMVLSLGAFRLSKKHAVAKRLNRFETLGSVTVIATDKTGTLTENWMKAVRFEPANARGRLLEIGMVCNNAVAVGEDFSGDAADTALLRAARDSGLDVALERKKRPALNEFPFDNIRKRMSTVSIEDGKIWAAVKGAPEAILPRCARILNGEQPENLAEADRQAVMDQAVRMAGEGLRVLAFAERALPNDNANQETAESDLTLIGLVGFQDPPRPEARDAIAACRQAGIRVIMITGDHPLTASVLARQVGLDGKTGVLTGPEVDRLSDEELQIVVRRVSIFARTAPAHKLRIVQALQAAGERVAVTGDGVNDAPALSAADIGLAMGRSGSDVAREAADIVLLDDNFATIVSAIKEGRLIYENLKKGVRYYLACKLALVMVNLLPVLLLLPAPFAPVQIILMELFMDLMAAAAFVAEKPESDLLQQKPRDPREKFMDRAMTASIVASSLGLFAAVTSVYLFAWFSTHDPATSQTVAFSGWLVGHVLLAFNMRSERQPVFQLGLAGNRLMLLWGAVVAAFLVLTAVLPGAQSLVKIAPLTGAQWAMILTANIIGSFWMEVRKWIACRSNRR